MDDKVNLEQGFTPANPTLLATAVNGSYFDENPVDNDPYTEEDPDEVDYLGEANSEADADDLSSCYSDVSGNAQPIFDD